MSKAAQQIAAATSNAEASVTPLAPQRFQVKTWSKRYHEYYIKDTLLGFAHYDEKNANGCFPTHDRAAMRAAELNEVSR